MSLKVSNLSKKYGLKTVVEKLDFEITKPGVYALLGTNGAGKTTSIRMILGMLSRDSGEVMWGSAPFSLDACNVGYMAEERGLYPKYTLLDQLIYFAGLRGLSKSEAEKRIDYWAERLEVGEYIYPASALITALTGGPKVSRAKPQKPMKADQLSKGNQQKIQFMVTLLSDPELLILDEPLSGLDPVNTDLFKSIIREEIDKGKYLIMSSHQMATVEEFCTDMTILSRSKTVLQGNLNEIKKSYGRVNLSLKTEQDATQYITASGARILTSKENEYEIKVDGDAQANALLCALVQNNVNIVTFDLREPSLHEIFVETVGGREDE